ncbi:MAG: endonuclease III, partial [Elusimicrobia bacterium]|nr:endonuclease III [Elusimicrobiota bacterium]
MKGTNQTPSPPPSPSRGEGRVRVKKIIAALMKTYPDSKCALNYSNPLELLVATILSAQCTDVRVNQVTQTLFKKYRTAKDYAQADPFIFEREIRSTGFYRMKAKSILSACRMLEERWGGKIPETMEELTQLPGVGRKTANVILGNCFQAQGIVVDTHVKRIASRLGLTKQTDPEKIERDLMPIIPKKDWTRFAFLLIDHGRAICKAVTPQCFQCPIDRLCSYPLKRQMRGDALVLALLLATALLAMGTLVSILTQLQSKRSLNYNQVLKARTLAEAGVAQALWVIKTTTGPVKEISGELGGVGKYQAAIQIEDGAVMIQAVGKTSGL